MAYLPLDIRARLSFICILVISSHAQPVNRFCHRAVSLSRAISLKLDNVRSLIVIVGRGYVEFDDAIQLHRHYGASTQATVGLGAMHNICSKGRKF